MQRAAALAVAALAVTVGGTGPIVLIHDGVIDSYMCTVLLTAFPDRFVGEVVVNADSTVPANMFAASKLHKVLEAAKGMTDVGLTLSDARMYNAFPWDYRGDAQRFLDLPEFDDVKANVSWPFENGEEWLQNVLREHTNVTVVLVAAATTLTDVLKREPELVNSISTILWMAGAMHVAGNLDPSQFDWNNSVAEWNVFADPFAAATLVDLVAEAPTRLLYYPLDIADQTPLDKDFYDLMKKAVDEQIPGTPKYKLHKLIYDAYVLVEDQPFYRLWDTVAAGWLLWPELYGEVQEGLFRVSTGLVDQGGILPCGEQGVDGCQLFEYFTGFASEAARQQFIRNVASF